MRLDSPSVVSYDGAMTFHDTTTAIFENSDDIFAHWRAEDAMIAEQAYADSKRDAAYAAAAADDKDAVMQAWDEGWLDNDTAALVLYGCNCRRCRKSDPGGCVG